ncbi:hypothetical protein A6R68_04473, partial [Neotoma lepida]
MDSALQRKAAGDSERILTRPLARSHVEAALPTSASLKTLLPVPTFEDVSIPERSKLKFVERVLLVPKVRREPKNLKDIRGPSAEATEFTEGNFAILALGGGYLHWGHFGMMRLTINRSMDAKNMFVIWRVPAPFKPITRKGVGQRMGRGKGAIDHYVTPVKEDWLPHSRDGQTLCTKFKKRESDQNPGTFEHIATANMLGIQKYLSPYDLQKGRYWGKFYLPK